jgi:hypothetical protein
MYVVAYHHLSVDLTMFMRIPIFFPIHVNQTPKLNFRVFPISIFFLESCDPYKPLKVQFEHNL